MTDRTYDLNAWLETYKDTFTSFTRAQYDGFKALERFARFHYAVAGDVLEAGLAQAKATLSARAGVGTTLIAEVQESVGNFAADAANRARGAKKAA
jgi:hypothetical protein